MRSLSERAVESIDPNLRFRSCCPIFFLHSGPMVSHVTITGTASCAYKMPHERSARLARADRAYDEATNSIRHHGESRGAFVG